MTGFRHRSRAVIESCIARIFRRRLSPEGASVAVELKEESSMPEQKWSPIADKIMTKLKKKGPTGSRTQVAGFKVQSANHYTIEPFPSSATAAVDRDRRGGFEDEREAKQVLKMEEEKVLKIEEEKVLTILHGAVIITMDEEKRVFKNGAIVIEQDRIKAIDQSSYILSQFSHLALHILDLNGHILLPGLINTHVHTSQQLARGIADDVDLMTWLHDRIWPYESNMNEHDSYLSTLLCGIELIHSGVTCFAEAGGQHVSGMARAVELLGLRACLSQSTMDYGHGLPSSWATITTHDCLQSQKDNYEKYHNTSQGRIRVWFGIRQIMNSTERLLLDTRDAARQLKTGIHMHVAEIPYENQLVMDVHKVNHGTVTYLDKIDFLQNNLLAAHSVWIDNNEISLLSRAGVKVSHCPAAAMRMLGFAPVREMLDADVCVSLGTDGAPSNNRMSIGSS
ncbi:hypothetical protein Lal_00000630 [Lupinus albus]|nr:hypothetical protein Lal_00000630 [Lupinus albus]